MNAQNNFEKHDLNMLDNFNIEYDYDSVLHYSQYAFAIDKSKQTIIPLKDMGDAQMGQRERLSKSDIKLINAMYCNETMNSSDDKISVENVDGLNKINDL